MNSFEIRWRLVSRRVPIQNTSTRTLWGDPFSRKDLPQLWEVLSSVSLQLSGPAGSLGLPVTMPLLEPYTDNWLMSGYKCLVTLAPLEQVQSYPMESAEAAVESLPILVSFSFLLRVLIPRHNLINILMLNLMSESSWGTQHVTTMNITA